MSYHTLIPSPLQTLRLAVLMLLLGGCASWHGAGSAGLGKLTVERLGWMDEVARVKQVRHLPITDAAREAALLQAMEEEGAAAGLPARAVHDCFSGQMEAARLRQAEWIKLHPQGDTSGKPLPDLAKTVRPALDGIGKEMIAALAQARTAQDSTEALTAARQQLSAAGYSAAVSGAALRGLKAGLEE